MKKIVLLTGLLSLTSAHAWDFSLKGDVQKAFTNNVNLTNTDPITDNYSILSGYLQAKSEEWKLKLKGRMEKYSNQTENDNYTTDLSLQYKASKSSDYTVGVYKQVYNGTPAVSTDTTSDNSGLRMAANFTHDFVKSKTLGYFSVSGNFRNYSKIEGRKDKILGLSLGLEQTIAKNFLLVPDLTFQHNSSADAYYSNNSLGPSLLLSYTPDDTWEIFGDISYARTTYSGRTVSKIVRNKTVTEKEYQELTTTDVGFIYSFPQYFSLTGKYTISTNSSNNSSSAYKANIAYLGVGLKF